MSDKWEVRDNYSDGESYKREEWNKLRDMVSLNEKLARVILDYLDRKGYSVTYPNPANNLSGVDIGGSIGLSNFDALNSAGNSTNSAVKGTEDIINSKLNSLDEKAQIGYRWVERQYSRGTETNLTASMINQMISREKENLSILEIIRFLEVVFGVSIDEINEQILNKVGMQVEVLESQSLTQNKRYYTDLDADATDFINSTGDGYAILTDNTKKKLICIDLVNWKVVKKTESSNQLVNRHWYNRGRYRSCYWDGTYWWYYEIVGRSSVPNLTTYLYWHKYDENGNEVDSGSYTIEQTYYDGYGAWTGISKAHLSNNYFYFVLRQCSTTNCYVEKKCSIKFIKVKDNSLTELCSLNNTGDFSIADDVLISLRMVDKIVLVSAALKNQGFFIGYGNDEGFVDYEEQSSLSGNVTSSSYGVNVIKFFDKAKYNAGGGVYTNISSYKRFWWHPCLRNGNSYIVDKFNTNISSILVNGLSLVYELGDGSIREMYRGEDRSSYANNNFSGSGPPSGIIIKDNLVIKVESDGIIRSDEYEWTPDEDFEGVVIVADNDTTSLSWGYPSSDGKIREYKQGVSTKINNCGHQTTARIYKVKFI